MDDCETVTYVSKHQNFKATVSNSCENYVLVDVKNMFELKIR